MHFFGNSRTEEKIVFDEILINELAYFNGNRNKQK